MNSENEWIRDAKNNGWWDNTSDLKSYLKDMEYDLATAKRLPIESMAKFDKELEQGVVLIKLRISEIESNSIKKQKEPWQMTNSEFVNSPNPSYEWYKQFGWPEGYTYNENLNYRKLTGHHGIIVSAWYKHLPIPKNVLAEYDDITNKWRPNKISQSENKAIHAWYAANPKKNKQLKKTTKQKTRRSSNSIKSIRG